MMQKFPGGVEDYAEAMTEQIADNLRRGKAPDGRWLGGLNGDAKERRAQLAAQNARGGAADKRYTDPKYRKKVKKNWDRHRDLSVPVVSRPRGHFSGFLARALEVQQYGNDLGYRVYQPFNRSLSRVLNGRAVWNSRASESEHMEEIRLKILELIQTVKKRRR